MQQTLTMTRARPCMHSSTPSQPSASVVRDHVAVRGVCKEGRHVTPPLPTAPLAPQRGGYRRIHHYWSSKLWEGTDFVAFLLRLFLLRLVTFLLLLVFIFSARHAATRTHSKPSVRQGTLPCTVVHSRSRQSREALERFRNSSSFLLCLKTPRSIVPLGFGVLRPLLLAPL